MSDDSFDKASLIAALRARIAGDLELLRRRQQDTAAGATHDESRAEHAKDTRATEQSYLARGLAERVAALEESAARLAGLSPVRFAPSDPVAVGAIVVVASAPDPGDEMETKGNAKQSEDPVHYWLLPDAGGLELPSAAGPVRTLTPTSPLGRALLGLCAGDEGSVRSPRGERSFEVLAVF